jgi:aminopeptidase C
MLKSQRNRCWIYAITNILRTFVAKKYGINEFQLSQVRPLLSLSSAVTDLALKG